MLPIALPMGGATVAMKPHSESRSGAKGASGEDGSNPPSRTGSHSLLPGKGDTRKICGACCHGSQKKASYSDGGA